MSTLIREKISLIQGDIVELKVDVIVNAANDSLLGGGGVDGAIHYAAGPELLAECRTLNGCETGKAKITKGYNLPASSVIHTVGPIWQGGNYQEDQLLASCYFHCLKLATEYQLKTIAFPSISTGSYDFPLERATRIAVLMVKKFLKKKQDTSISQVIFVTFGQKAFQCYQDTINDMFG